MPQQGSSAALRPSTEAFEKLSRYWLGHLVNTNDDERILTPFAVHFSHVGAGHYVRVDPDHILGHTHMPVELRDPTSRAVLGALGAGPSRRSMDWADGVAVTPVLDDGPALAAAVDDGWAPIVPPSGGRFVLGTVWIGDSVLSLDGLLAHASGSLGLDAAFFDPTAPAAVNILSASYNFLDRRFSGLVLEDAAEEGAVPQQLGTFTLGAVSEIEWAEYFAETETVAPPAPPSTPQALPPIHSIVVFPNPVPVKKSITTEEWTKMRKLLSVVGKAGKRAARTAGGRMTRKHKRTQITAPLGVTVATHDMPSALPEGALSAPRRAVLSRVCEYYLTGYCAFGAACRKDHFVPNFVF